MHHVPSVSIEREGLWMRNFTRIPMQYRSYGSDFRTAMGWGWECWWGGHKLAWYQYWRRVGHVIDRCYPRRSQVWTLFLYCKNVALAYCPSWYQCGSWSKSLSLSLFFSLSSLSLLFFLSLSMFGWSLSLSLFLSLWENSLSLSLSLPFSISRSCSPVFLDVEFSKLHPGDTFADDLQFSWHCPAGVLRQTPAKVLGGFDDYKSGTPGDYGWKLLTSSDPDEKAYKLQAELANGRLAMVAIMAMIFQNGTVGTTSSEMWLASNNAWTPWVRHAVRQSLCGCVVFVCASLKTVSSLKRRLGRFSYSLCFFP